MPLAGFSGGGEEMPSPARVGRLLRFALPAAFSVGMFLQFGRCLPVGMSHSDAAGADEGASGERSRKASTRVQAKMGRARFDLAVEPDSARALVVQT